MRGTHLSESGHFCLLKACRTRYLAGINSLLRRFALFAEHASLPTFMHQTWALCVSSQPASDLLAMLVQ
jgi:hypothetical protein